MTTNTEGSGLETKVSSLVTKVKSIFLNASLRPVYGRLGGRSFLVVAFFAITGYLLERNGKLTDSYAALATALSGFHIWRSTCEDKKRDGQKDS